MRLRGQLRRILGSLIAGISMTTVAAPVCLMCVFYKDAQGTGVCDAFPGGIPVGIFANEIDHRAPVEGDNGIQFQGRTLDDEQYASMIFDR